MFMYEFKYVRQFAEQVEVSSLEEPVVLLAAGMQGKLAEWHEIQAALVTALKSIEEDWLVCDFVAGVVFRAYPRCCLCLPAPSLVL